MSDCACCGFACAVCKILLYNVRLYTHCLFNGFLYHPPIPHIHQCFRKIKGGGGEYEYHRPEYTILCLGLQGAGKSTLLAKLAGETTYNIEPTKGRNLFELSHALN